MSKKIIEQLSYIDDKFLDEALGALEDDFEAGSKAKVYYPQRVSPFKRIMPFAAAAAVLAVAIPAGLHFAGKNGENTVPLDSANSAGVSLAPNSSASETNSSYQTVDKTWNYSSIRYISSHGRNNVAYPSVFKVSSRAELEKCFNNSELDALSEFDSKFFEKDSLFIVNLAEQSGSIKDTVDNIRIMETYPTSFVIDVKREVPEVMTGDMQYVSILIPVGKNSANNAGVIEVFVDGELKTHADLSKKLPVISEIAQMSNEDAAAALSGKTVEQLIVSWGEPAGTLSGFSGYIWHYEGKEITVYYDENLVVTNVIVGAAAPAGIHSNPNIPAVPSLAEFASLSFEEAKTILNGFSVDDIFKVWGEPEDSYSDDDGSKVLVWNYEAKHISVVLSADGGEIAGVMLFEER